jgi:hypothetical protein
MLARTDLTRQIGAERVYLTLDAAVADLARRTG